MSEIFRDRTEGAMARRQDLLRKRRDEFVMMPHAIRRVVVARAARVAGSTAIIVAGIGMVAASLSPTIAGTIARGMPGINPAVVSTFVAAAWVFGLVAYAISRARSEHRFAVEMMSRVLPSQNLDEDIERLSHEHPDEVARRMAHRLEIKSAALPVAAAAFVVPATLVYFAHAITNGGWPSTAAYELDLLASGKALLASALVGFGAAVMMTRTWARTPGAKAIASPLALVAGAIAIGAFAKDEVGATWLFSVVFVIAAAIALVNRSLVRERIAIDAEDPAAGSELFTLKGLIAEIRHKVMWVRRRVTPRMAIAFGAFTVLLVCAGAPIGKTSKNAAASASGPRMKRSSFQQSGSSYASQGGLGVSTYNIVPTTDGRLRVTVHLVSKKPLDIDNLAGIDRLPMNWKARISVRLEDGHSLPGSVELTPFPGNAKVLPLHFGSDSTEHRFASENCTSTDEQLGLSIVPGTDWPDGAFTATFLVEPVLELGNCAPTDQTF